MPGKPVLAFVEVPEGWEEEYLKKKFAESALSPLLQNCEVRFYKETVQELAGANSKTPLPVEISLLSVFIQSRLDRPLLAALPNLKFIATRSTGFDHIDVRAARERGIAVSNVPVYGENTVAEHTFALILSLSRNLRKAYFRTVQNNFSLEGLMGFDLKGKTIGVAGTGHIGLHLIRMAAGFGMKVLAFDTREQKFLSEILNFDYVTFEELLGRSDIISLHVPYLPATRHLINQKTIRLIKPGAILINTARGGLVETDALVKALDEKILSGAGLDVLEDEEYVLEEKRLLEGEVTNEHWQKLQTALKNHVLLHRENVIYTPHMAFYSAEAVRRILDTTLGNLASFLAGKPENRVD